jgi:hypothetical protein
MMEMEAPRSMLPKGTTVAVAASNMLQLSIYVFTANTQPLQSSRIRASKKSFGNVEFGRMHD